MGTYSPTSLGRRRFLRRRARHRAPRCMFLRARCSGLACTSARRRRPRPAKCRSRVPRRRRRARSPCRSARRHCRRGRRCTGRRPYRVAPTGSGLRSTRSDTRRHKRRSADDSWRRRRTGRHRAPRPKDTGTPRGTLRASPRRANLRTRSRGHRACSRDEHTVDGLGAGWGGQERVRAGIHAESKYSKRSRFGSRATSRRSRGVKAGLSPSKPRQMGLISP